MVCFAKLLEFVLTSEVGVLFRWAPYSSMNVYQGMKGRCAMDDPARPLCIFPIHLPHSALHYIMHHFQHRCLGLIGVLGLGRVAVESSYLFLLEFHNNVWQVPTNHSSTILRIRCDLSVHLLNSGPRRNRMLGYRVSADCGLVIFAIVRNRGGAIVVQWKYCGCLVY